VANFRTSPLEKSEFVGNFLFFCVNSKKLAKNPKKIAKLWKPQNWKILFTKKIKKRERKSKAECLM
jgi:hypothetical protein